MLDWSQEFLAEEVNRAPQAVSTWETKRVKPPRRVLEALAKKHGWPVEIFAEGGPTPSEAITAARNDQPLRNEETPPDEQQFRDFLRNIERTARAIVGDPTLWSAEEHRINQLGVVRSIMRKAAELGRPIPDWLPRIYNELVSGTFT